MSRHAIARTSALPICLLHSSNYVLLLPVYCFNHHLTCVFRAHAIVLCGLETHWSLFLRGHKRVLHGLAEWFSRSDHNASSMGFTCIWSCIYLIEKPTSLCHV